jgi:Permuted papain-like amidase enzyme, YaeF/YiiX, C92 family
MNRIALLAAAALAVSALVGCGGEPKSILLKRPVNPETDTAVTQLWTGDIKRLAQDGDWILSRGYYMTSDAITTFTGGEDLSHASIYDAKRGTIIEAVGSGVREITLEQLLQRNAHIIVVRPSGMTEEQRTRSVERARSRIGAEFDKLGLIGIDNKDKVYCSELVWWASQVELRTGEHQTVITPSELMDYGQVVYWSGERDNSQIMELAVEQDRTRTANRRVASTR